MAGTIVPAISLGGVMSDVYKARFELTRGVMLTITPITTMAQRALHSKAAKLYPEPDRTPYEVEIDDALVAGTKTNAADSPEWLRQMTDVLVKRQQAYIGLLLDMAVTTDDRQATIDPYLEQINYFKDAVDGTAAAAGVVNDFIACLLGVLAEESEVTDIIKLAQGATPLTDGEIMDGFRFFRGVVVQRTKRPVDPKVKKSQDIQTTATRLDRPADDGIRGGVDVWDAGGSKSDRDGKQLVRTPATGDEGDQSGLHQIEIAGSVISPERS